LSQQPRTAHSGGVRAISWEQMCPKLEENNVMFISSLVMAHFVFKLVVQVFTAFVVDFR